MNYLGRARAACFAVITAAMLALAAGPAGGANPCAQRVLEDWSDNGRIDRVYQLHCYEEAIDALPPDLRDYTNAADIIDRALTAALRARGVSGEFTEPVLPAAGVATSGASVPVLALVAGGVAFAIVLAGAVAYLARRRGTS